MPEVQNVFDNIKLGTAVPTPPVLIVQAVHDQMISVEDIDELADTYSAGGARVTYHRDMFSEHLLLHPLSAPMTLRWLTDRFAGKPLSEHIVRTKWPTMLNPMTYVGMARLAQDRREGGHGADGRALSAVTGCARNRFLRRPAAQIVASGRHRDQRVDQRRHRGGKQDRRRDLSGECPKNTAGASMT